MLSLKRKKKVTKKIAAPEKAEKTPSRKAKATPAKQGVQGQRLRVNPNPASETSHERNVARVGRLKLALSKEEGKDSPNPDRLANLGRELEIRKLGIKQFKISQGGK